MICRFFDALRAFAGRPQPALVWLLLFAVFVTALFLRLSLPGLPLTDPDTWGYLFPALSEMSGSGFLQTHGRGIFYPLFLLGILEASHDLFAIVSVQHLLGLLSGILWWLAWILWTDWLPGSLGRAFWVRCIGIFFLALYLWNARAIIYESSIRPEGVFPFLALAQVCLCLLYARSRWRKPDAVLMIFSGAAAILSAVLCLSAKPSWGLAALVPLALVVVGLFGNGTGKILFLRTVTLALGLLVVVVWDKLVPPAVGWVADESSKSFLPATLFTVHAPVVEKAMRMRVERGTASAEEKRFLEHWQKRLEESRSLPKTAYQVLAHDPDYLMYHSDALVGAPVSARTGHTRDFLMQTYLQGVFSFPVDVAAKVARQLVYSCGDLSRSLYSPRTGWLPWLDISRTTLAWYELPVALPPRILASFELLRAETESIIQTAPRNITLGPPISGFLLREFGPLFLGLWMFAWPAILVFSFFKGIRPGPDGVVRALYISGIFWATCFGTTLTVSMVHSFDIDRYLHLLSAQQSLVLASGLALSLLFLGQTVARLRMLRGPALGAGDC